MLVGAARPVRRPRACKTKADVTPSSTVAENPLAEGLERLPVHPTTLVIFGATGDLARRKLLPALYNLAHEGALPERFNLVGVVARGAAATRSSASRRSSRSASSRAATPDETVLDAAARRRRATSPARSTTPDVYERLAETCARVRRGGRRSR